MSVVSLPVNEHWDNVLRNVGYSVIAGVVLIFLVSVFDALRAAVKADRE